jgi:hypothetical protein
MNGHKQLNLILALLLLPAAMVGPIRSATTPGTNSLLPAMLQGIPGATVDWWVAVQEYFHQSKYLETRQMAGITGLSLIPNWGDEGDQEGAQFGFSVGTAGDVNGDGYDDVIVGAPFYDHGQNAEGAAAVYHGSAAGLALNPNWMGESNIVNANFGYSVGTAGDVNGDGYDDIIIGAPGYTNGQSVEGAATVYLGSAAGLSLVPSWGDESDQANAQFGWSVGTAGDVNADGYDDVVVGAIYYDHGQTNEGAAVVYHGSAAGLTLIPNWMGESNQADAYFGYSVGTAGDVNGDGFADVIVGVPYYSNGQDTEGAVAVYHGSASGLSLVPSWGDESDQDLTYFGYSVGTAGDVNGDGFSDVIIGIPGYTNGQTVEGAVAVYHGSAAGLSLVPSWGDESNLANAQFGYSVGTAGDVNGDGYSDVIVGAPDYTNGQDGEGAAVVYHGSVSGLSLTPNWGDEGDQAGAQFAFSVGTAGDVNGDGYSDVIIGAPTYDHGQVDEGAAAVYHGSGDNDVYNYIYLPLTLRNP